jgi:hypothetical protein
MRSLKYLVLLGGGLLTARMACAQAPPGPLPPPEHSASSSAPPPPPVAKVAPRKTIFGDWKLNHDDSDDPRTKMHKATASNPNNGNMGGPRMGGWPGGMGGMGGPRQTRNPQPDMNETNEKLQALIDPSVRLNLYQKDAKDPQVELTGDQGKKMIFYTDGQKPDKSSDPNQLMVSARWDGAKLVSDEDLAKNGKLNRTFELSEDGTQLYEEVRVDTGKKKDTPVTIRYVYDAVNPAHGS